MSYSPSSHLTRTRAITVFDDAGEQIHHNLNTPTSRKNTRGLQLRSASRINSTSVLKIKQKEKKESIDEDVTNYTLPIVEIKDSTMAFRRLEASTLGNLMKSLPQEEFLSRFILVDCRYPYEFHGGHIKYAINLYEQKECDNFFFGENFNKNRIPIFYCEYSQKRGPTMATILRSNDRCRNVHRYPNLTFNEIYVVDGGYKGFYNWTKESKLDEMLCTPCDYIPMDDDRFAAELRQFTFHRKNYRPTATSRIIPKNTEDQSRIGLLKTKPVEKTLIKRAVEKRRRERASPYVVPTRLNFSFCSPEV